MAKPYVINITDGQGQEYITKDTYTVTATSTGYDSDSITPSSVEITDTDSYAFTIAATGTLTLHVTAEGTTEGTPIVGAVFRRTDATGNPYGSEITTNAEGNAVFSNVPYAATGAPNIYYMQTASDGNHDFDNTVQTITLTDSTRTEEIANPAAELKTITLTDANYDGLVIASAQLTLN